MACIDKITENYFPIISDNPINFQMLTFDTDIKVFIIIRMKNDNKSFSIACFVSIEF